MLSFGRKKKSVGEYAPTMPDQQAEYMKDAGLTPISSVPETKPKKKKRPQLDPGGQPYRFEDRQA